MPALAAVMARLAAGYARWLSQEVEDALLVAVFGAVVIVVKTVADKPGSGAAAEQQARTSSNNCIRAVIHVRLFALS